MKKEIVLAADLGGTNLRIAAIDSAGGILYRTRSETPRGGGAGEIVRVIVECANECRENCAGFEIKAVSAAVPGTVNYSQGEIITAPNLPALNNFQLVAALENALETRAIIENDANAAAIGENWLGASKCFDNSILVTLGTGIGGGIIINREILRGAGGMAGEIGHLCVESLGVPCPCGSRGCVEQYSSASAIVRMATDLAAQDPESVLKNEVPLNAFKIFQAGKNGDETALEAFRQMGFYLGVAITSLLNILNTEIVVVSGGVSAGWELFSPRMFKTIRQRAYGGRQEQLAKIALSELGDDAGILGAARLAFDLLE